MLLLGPGMNVEKQKDRIESYVKENDQSSYQSTSVSELFKRDYIFLSKRSVYVS